MPRNPTNPVTKPVRTARTPEENQERAYIAASRRSDRNLEARIESARRASKIHKRRTGRSLRVTEQAVLKEERYEEEEEDDDDGHRQTGSPGFSGGLAACLTTHAGIETALDQALPTSCTQTYQYPKQPQYVHYIPVQQQPPANTTPIIPCEMIHRAPPTYCQTPYPVPTPQGFRTQPYNSSVTFSKPEEIAQLVPADPSRSPFDTCSVSMPSHGSPPTTLVAPQHQPYSALSHKLTSLYRSPSTYTPTQVLSPPSDDGENPVKAQHVSQQNFNETSHPCWPAAMPASQPAPFHANYGPFSTSLPIGSRQLLGFAVDPNDRYSSMLTASNDIAIRRPYYRYNHNRGPMNARMFHPAFDGISESLAPSGIDSNFSKSNYIGPQQTTIDSIATCHACLRVRSADLGVFRA